MQTGRWSFIAPNKIAIFDTSQVIYKAMQVVELKQDLLRVILVN